MKRKPYQDEDTTYIIMHSIFRVIPQIKMREGSCSIDSVVVASFYALAFPTYIENFLMLSREQTIILTCSNAVVGLN